MRTVPLLSLPIGGGHSPTLQVHSEIGKLSKPDPMRNSPKLLLKLLKKRFFKLVGAIGEWAVRVVETGEGRNN